MYTMDFAQVGANIQKQLHISGFTQQSLADALSISKQVMNKIIKGNKAINVQELAKIASVLHTTTDKLLSVPSVPIPKDAIDEIHMLEELLYAQRIE